MIAKVVLFKDYLGRSNHLRLMKLSIFNMICSGSFSKIKTEYLKK